MQNSSNFDIMSTELELGDKSLVQLIDLKELFKSYNLTAKIKTVSLLVPKLCLIEIFKFSNLMSHNRKVWTFWAKQKYTYPIIFLIGFDCVHQNSKFCICLLCENLFYFCTGLLEAYSMVFREGQLEL
jgi:hypothetical protein